jgi:predicted alpha/beta-hydrolase family hydrolase
VLRDVLAIARALYRVETDPVRLQEVVEVGKGLREAIYVAGLGARTVGGRAAPAYAAKMTARLCALVDESTPLQPALPAVADKLTR